MTATSAATIPELVEPAALGKSETWDVAMSAEAGLATSSSLRAKGKMAAVCPNARVAMAALATNQTVLTRLCLEQAQSSHERDTEADRGQSQDNGCRCCELAASALYQNPTDGASWISGATAFVNLFSGCGEVEVYQKSWGRECCRFCPDPIAIVQRIH